MEVRRIVIVRVDDDSQTSDAVDELPRLSQNQLS